MKNVSRFNYDWSDQKLQRYIKDGRGQGEGEVYKPWLNVHSIASRGRVSRVCGWKTGRVHHFLADNELRYFYLLEWEDTVQDIREHYPLLDLYDMTEILDDALLKKLLDRKTGTPHILTSTFLVTAKNEQGKTVYFARSIKEAKDFEKPSVIERYECIRRYFQAKGISWGLVTPAEINAVRAKNVEWLHAARQLNDWSFPEDQVQGELHLLTDMLSRRTETIREVQGDSGKGLLLFKHLLATKIIGMDMDKPIDINQSADRVKISTVGVVEGGIKRIYAVGG
jgi:hypothetical protein